MPRFGAGDFLATAFSHEGAPRIGLAVYHGTQPGPQSLLYAHSPKDMPRSARFTRNAQVEVAGQPWTFVFRSASAAGEAWIQPTLLAATGVALSLLLAVLWRRQQLAAEAAREDARTLETLNRVGRMLAIELDVEHIVQAVTDAATELSGAKFGAFFYNVTNAAGESYLLHALSGAPREAFARFGTPRNTAIFLAPTFAGQGVLRLEGRHEGRRVTENSAPHRGGCRRRPPARAQLPGRPVVSRSGEPIGGLFFEDHPDVRQHSTDAPYVSPARHRRAGRDRRLQRTGFTNAPAG